MDNINLDQMLSEAAGEDIEPVQEDNVQEAPVVDEPVVDEPAPEPEKEQEKQPEQKKNNPIKEVRDRLNLEQKAKEKIEKTIQRFTDGDYKFKIRDFRTDDGKVDYDALAKAMDDEDLKVKAESRGISPEVQAEIERIEKEKVELQRERLRVSMDRAIAGMQTDMNLKNEDINNFFKDSMALKKNPYQWLAQGGSLHDLYYLVYRERLVKEEIAKAVDEAKAKWETANNKKPPVSNPATPASSKTDPNQISLDDLLKSAIK